MLFDGDLLFGQILHRDRVHCRVDGFDAKLDLRHQQVIALVDDDDVMYLPGIYRTEQNKTKKNRPTKHLNTEKTRSGLIE